MIEITYMKTPEIPACEPGRIKALNKLCILDTPPEERFDRLTRVAKRYFQVPIALISLVDSDRQWFKSRQGLDASETPRDISFCGHAILDDKVLYIPNALEDDRFADNPLVTGPPDIRFYAGAPLHASTGERIGTLCIIDDKPRELTSEQFEVLRDLADAIETELKQVNLVKSAKGIVRLAMVAEQIDNAVIITDHNGLIEWVNRGFEKITGYTLDEVSGKKPGHILQGPDTDPATIELLRKNINAGKSIQTEILNYHKNGAPYWLDLLIQPVLNDEGEIKEFIAVESDISARKQAENNLRSSEEKIKAVLNTVLDGIITIDTQGIVHTFNPAAERIFGYAAKEVIGRNVNTLMPKKYSEHHDSYLSNYLQTGNAKVIGIGREVEGMRKDGSTFPLELAVSKMTINNKQMFTGIVRDITERKRLDEMKKEFISTVSHELRTPLTSIRGALGLVLGKFAEQLPDKAMKMLLMAERNSKRLTLLINDILDLEKIESGNLTFEYENIDLVNLVNHAIEDNEGFAQKHHVQLKFKSSLNQALVYADQHRIQQVLANLISNAVKYTPENGLVEVVVDKPELNYRVKVCDHGPGIPEEFRKRIFSRFAQADSSDTREKGGTGLGLSISKAIIERHTGSIDYKSDVGKGSTFYFELPALEITKSDSKKANTKDKVLICEDNPDIAELLVDMLESQKVDCDVAYSAEQARSLLAGNNYRLMLLDLTLPDTDGLVFIRELRAKKKTEHMPIIVVSGRAKEGRKAFNGDAMMVVDWLQKPVEQNRLKTALTHALNTNTRPRILHVEDDLDIVQIVRSLLEEMADLSNVGSLKGAREQLNNQQFDLVILDLGLADGSGIELLDELKGRCPVLIFSAQKPDLLTTSQVTGALTKSTTSNEQLLQTIKKVIGA